MTLWDISPPVDARSPVSSGDPQTRPHPAARSAPGAQPAWSAGTNLPHPGAHTDAPLRYDAAGAAVGMLDLAPYLGPCRVIHAWGMRSIGQGERLIRWAHLAHRIDADLPPRVLLRTCEQARFDQIDHATAAFAPETIDRLADLGVQLVGIDSASIDPAGSKDWPSRQVGRRRGLRVLQNLVLDVVPEGDYELIALPLRWMSADASPVRAVLRELTTPLRAILALPAPEDPAFADTPFENSRPRELD
jgi:arylformamidase